MSLSVGRFCVSNMVPSFSPVELAIHGVEMKERLQRRGGAFTDRYTDCVSVRTLSSYLTQELSKKPQHLCLVEKTSFIVVNAFQSIFQHQHLFILILEVSAPTFILSDSGSFRGAGK